jgi:hypothetical protein
MQVTTTHIIPVLMLIIPFHGFFLSLFFAFRSNGQFISNYLMGLLLITLSSLSLEQIIMLIYPAQIHVYESDFGILPDLLLSPLLFLYTASILRSTTTHKIHFHLLVLLLNLLLLFISEFAVGLFKDLMIITVFVINCQYFFQALFMFTGIIKGLVSRRRDIPMQDYSVIVIINLLIFINIILAAICSVICAGIDTSIILLPKGILVFYLYYLILQTSDFNLGADESKR